MRADASPLSTFCHDTELFQRYARYVARIGIRLLGEKLNRVAECCGCSIATAKRRIVAAQARLQAELDDG